MRQCNECANRKCHLIHAPRVQFKVNKVTGEKTMKDPELRKSHDIPRKQMMQYCDIHVPIKRRGATILEHVVYNSPLDTAKLLDIMEMKIIDVSYPPFFKIVPVRQHPKRRKKKFRNRRSK